MNMQAIPAIAAQIAPALVLNAPHLFRDSAFIEWLNSDVPKFTWHKDGQPGEWSDAVVLVDPSLNGEGSDSDMPEHCWDAIVDACRNAFGNLPRGTQHIMVRLTNLSEDSGAEPKPREAISITNGQLSAILHHLLTDPFSGEIDDQSLFQEFCADLVEVVTNYCGGELVGVPAYAPALGDIRWDQHYRMEVRPNESSPENGGIWAKVQEICSTKVVPQGGTSARKPKPIQMLSHGILDHLPRGEDGQKLEAAIVEHVQGVLDACMKAADEQWVADPRVSASQAIQKILPKA